MKCKLSGAIALLILFDAAQACAGDIREEEVLFKANQTGATIEDSIKGRETVDYHLRAKSGQRMRVSLSTSNLSNYFNVLPPGSETALFVGSSDGGAWNGLLPTGGEYTIRVYLYRNAARRNETAKYKLSIEVGDGSLGDAPASDANVSGMPYHATGRVPCSFGPDPKGSAQCEFGAIRGKPGNAEVHVTPPWGERRVLYFTGAKVTVADPKARLKASKSGDNWSIGIDDLEYYEIPMAVIDGG